MSDEQEQVKNAPEDAGKAYEASDAKFRPLLWSGVALIALMALAFLVITAIFSFFKEQKTKSDRPRSPLAVEKQLTPLPRLEVEPIVELRHLQAIEDSLLHHYGWVTKDAGIVRIPIDSAMSLMLERGFPVRSQAQETKPGRSRIEDGR